MEDETLSESSSDDYRARENLWDEAMPRTEGEHPPEEPDNLDEELPFPDTVGTIDPIEAVRDAEPYTPPIDPPVLPGGEEGIHVATGFGLSTEEEDYGSPPPRGDEDIYDEVTCMLQDDSSTSKLPLTVDVDQGVVRLMGEVPSAQDAELAITLIGSVRGVVDVIDDTVVAATPVE